MRLPAWVAPLAVALAVAAAFALMIYAVYQALMWFAAMITYAIIGLFVIGYGLDPAIIAPSSGMPWTT